MVHIAILGYGVIGSGIMRVLEQNRVHIEKKAGQAIVVKRVLDIRDFPGDPVEPILTHNFDDILNDDEIKIVAEGMGGDEPAYTYAKAALLRGKSVCTSNKELVINHGAELLRIAKERELNFMFEASVGGGIPIVRPMNLALTTDAVVGVAGILNGTTNYILTRMNAFDMSFDEALREAQSLGYAEKNPAADVEGYDACRKLAILLSLATGYQVDYADIHTEGISRVTRTDFAFARHFGYSIKLLVDGRIRQDTPNALPRVEAMVAPCLVHHQHPLSTVTDVFNGVLVQAKVTDNVMFYGRGAGKLPTAGAVVSDIVDVSKHLHRHIMHAWAETKIPLDDWNGYVKRKLIRISYTDEAKAIAAVQAAYPGELFGQDNRLAWLTPPETERETAQKMAALARMPGVEAVEAVYRIYEPIEI